MSWLKFSMMLTMGTLLVGLRSPAALSQDSPRPRDVQDTKPESADPANASSSVDPFQGQPPRARTPVKPDTASSVDPFQGQPPRARTPVKPDTAAPDSPSGDWRQLPADPTRRGRRLGNVSPKPETPVFDYVAPSVRWRAAAAFEMNPKTDPELYKATFEDQTLEQRSRELAGKYRQAGGSEDKGKIKKELVDTVNEHFEVRQQLRNLEVKRLEQQVKQLRDKIELRVKNRKDLVDKRIIELTGEDEGEHF